MKREAKKVFLSDLRRNNCTTPHAPTPLRKSSIKKESKICIESDGMGTKGKKSSCFRFADDRDLATYKFEGIERNITVRNAEYIIADRDND